MTMEEDTVDRSPRRIDRTRIFKGNFARKILKRSRYSPIEVENFMIKNKVYWNGDLELKENGVHSHCYYTEMFWSIMKRIPTGVHEISEIESFKPRRPIVLLLRFFGSYLYLTKLKKSLS